MSGAVAALCGGSVIGAFFPFVSWQAIGDGAVGGATQGGMRFNSDGSITNLDTNPSASDSPGSPQWCSIVQAGVGSAFWLRATVTGGSISSGTTGSWLSLASAQSFIKGPATNGGASCTVTFELSTDAAGATIVASWTGNLLGYAHGL